jgi:hypothetical protein
MCARCPKRDPVAGSGSSLGLWLTTSLAQTAQTTTGNGVAAAGTCRENCATVFADELSRAHL